MSTFELFRTFAHNLSICAAVDESPGYANQIDGNSLHSWILVCPESYERVLATLVPASGERAIDGSCSPWSSSAALWQRAPEHRGLLNAQSRRIVCNIVMVIASEWPSRAPLSVTRSDSASIHSLHHRCLFCLITPTVMSMSMSTPASSTSMSMPSMAATATMPAMTMPTGGMMAFNTDNLASMLYSTSWMPTTTAGYVGTWFFLFFLAMIWRALVFTLARLDAYWIARHEGHAIFINGGHDQVNRRNTIQAWRLSVNLPRAALAMVNQAVAYLLYVSDS